LQKEKGPKSSLGVKGQSEAGSNGFDLAYTSVILEPTMDDAYRVGCKRRIVALPHSDRTQGTTLNLRDDDSQEVSLLDGKA